jgi:hypothetical protein
MHFTKTTIFIAVTYLFAMVGSVSATDSLVVGTEGICSPKHGICTPNGPVKCCPGLACKQIEGAPKGEFVS